MPFTVHDLARIIRRPRLITAALLALVVFIALLPLMQRTRAILIGFDVGATLFLILMGVLMARATPTAMHRRAKLQDEGK